MDRFQRKTRTEELSTGGYEEIKNLHSNFSLKKQKNIRDLWKKSRSQCRDLRMYFCSVHVLKEGDLTTQ